jgi:ATP-binding cassette subfamily C protein
VLQFLSSISKLRVAGAEIQAFAVWAERFGQQRRHQLRSRTTANMLATFNAGLPLVCQLVIFALAASLLTSEQSLRTGDFLAFMAAFTICLNGMLQASQAIVRAAVVIPMYEHARPILTALPEVDSGKADPGQLSGSIEVQHLSFRYQEDGPLVLRDVSLQIDAGEFVALVGPSGSGKSTTLRLLLGFEEPEAGNIYYDGQEFSGLDRQAVRNQIGVVLQGGRLMAGDIFTNIVGSSLATMDDAWEAARMAGLDGDIEAMPMGMHTVISEGGGTFSGGQRQRLMIARALVRRPKMLYFDEATSALDNRTQSIVSKSLERMRASRIVIAHRLSTIQHADRIYVLDKGRVVETGTYDELISRKGPFYELAKRQLA